MSSPQQNIVIASYAAGEPELRHVVRLARSLRRFGGRYAGLTVRAYVPSTTEFDLEPICGELRNTGGECRQFEIPAEIGWLGYTGKVYAAAQAERDAVDVDLLVYMDEDTLLIGEPAELDLSPGIALAYCPVMHNRSGSLYAQPADPLWSRVYDLLDLTDEMLFPMITPADQKTIRAYFHAGLLVVRPESKIMQGWVKAYELLAQDSEVETVCRAERIAWVFLHQMALVGPILQSVSREEMLELPGSYNYPIFFERKFGGVRLFDSIEGVITVRHVVEPGKLGTDWYLELNGPREIAAWLYDQLRDSAPG